jgi:hypothetical protein
MAVPYTFQLSTIPIPLANLDANFTYFTTAISVSGTDVTVAGTTTTAAAVVNANNATNALRITQVGTGNALLVEDEANPDATPFVIDASGRGVFGSTSYIQVNTYSNNEPLSIFSTGSPGLQIGDFGANQFAGGVNFAKSRSGTVGLNTIVNNGDALGNILFNGYDGTAYRQGALIIATVDGTPATSDMPTRLSFFVTEDGASTPTERMRINNAGNIFFGGNTANNNFSLTLGKRITGATNAAALFVSSQIQTDVTNTATYFSTSVAQIVGTTTTNVRHYGTAQGIISGTITNQSGFYADAGLISAANNFGFSSNIPLGTSRTITFVQRTTNVVTITTSVAHGYTAGQSVTVAATTNTGVNGTFVIASVPTTTTFTYAQTAANIVLVADTGSTIVVNRFNIYSAGTAPNYFLGNVGIGTTAPNAPLEVVNASSAIAARGSATTSTAFVGALAHDYYSAASFKATYLYQNSSAATGTTLGFANANMGWLAFQNGGAQALIYTNGGSAIVFGTTSVDRGRVSSTGVWSFGAAAGSESLRVTPVASAVNYYNAQGSTTGNTPRLSVQGSDANIQFAVSSKGTQSLNFFTNTWGQQQFQINHTASAVNYFTVTGNATGGGPTLTAVGSDANVSTNFTTKGTGSHVFYTNGSAPQLVVAHTASAVNYHQLTGSATGSAVVHSAQGSDTNIDLALTPKGTGNVRFGTLTANADAPVTGYITIKDSAGTVRKLAVIA